jgi:hypothetical protein
MKTGSFIKDYGLRSYERTSKDLPYSGSDQWTLICLLPHNSQFQLWMEVESDAGRQISFNSTNHLAACMQPVQAYTTIQGVQTYETPGWISGQGAVYTIPPGVTVRAVKYRETGYDTEFAGSFRCNDDDYNILWTKATRTCYLCMRDHFMDCPDRERTPDCLGDVCIQMEEIFYAFDTKAHALAREAILGKPKYDWIIDQNLVFAGEYGTWFYYLNTGDVETIRTQYPNLKAYLAKWPLGDNGLTVHNTDGRDWCDWGSPSKDKTVVQCCQYYSTLKACRKMAVVTGNTDDLAEYDRKLGSIERNFDAVYWTGRYYKSGNVDYPDERANAMAVITGLASRDKWETIFDEVLSKKLNSHWEAGQTYNASCYFERWVMEALCMMGQEEFALIRMYERYADQIESSTTTLWEHFGRWWQTSFDPNSTMNHGWNSPNTILSRYIAGVSPVEAGWAVYTVLPKEAFLKSISVHVDTIKGGISVDIAKTSRDYAIGLVSPSGTEAVIGIPLKSFRTLDDVQINGVTVWRDGNPCEAAGVRWVGESDGYLKFSLPPGEWKCVAHGRLHGAEAKPPRAATVPSTRIDSKGWKATASHVHRGPTLSYKLGKKDDGNPNDAINGDVWTCWSTGVPQSPGQWFMVDLGKPETFDTIVLENYWAPYDYPKGYELFLSDNGNTWGSAVVVNKGRQGMTKIDVGTRTSQFIKLQLTEESTYWWSIFDFRLYKTNKG